MAFEFELRDLSYVPRWSTVRLINPQNVADHQYFTAIYALQICDLLDDGSEIDSVISWEVRFHTVALALVHDLEETFLGDIPGPAKRAIVDRDKLDELSYQEIVARYPSLVDYTAPIGVPGYPDLVRGIIKAASLMDELMLLIQEWRMGNNLLKHVQRNSMNRLEAVWRAIPWDKDELNLIWNTEIIEAIAAAEHGELRHLLG
ncbi:hypothetical protein LCGC14_0626120 [marine sediment metagenome]|uniref:HD/PDEase domain-containing protein n=1 Tax=marine sediment metagenome TaxID=412755 RepID=A0A0F9RMS3_9ZZZZ